MSVYSYCPKCGGCLESRKIEEIERLVCDKCGYVLYENPKPTASAIIVDGDRVLLVRRAIKPQKGFWDLPGGFLEKDEHPEDGLRREVREELGVEIKIREFLGIYMDQYGYDEAGGSTLNVYYVVSIASGEPKPGSDVEDLCWFAVTDLPSDMAFNNCIEALKVWRARFSAEEDVFF